MTNVLQELSDRRDQARLGGGQVRIDKQHAKGKLTCLLYTSDAADE